MIDYKKDNISSFYCIKVDKAWFRRKAVFPKNVGSYQRLLDQNPVLTISLNAGNMIYDMLKRLSVDWEKQDALISGYRNLVYRLSYVDVLYKKSNSSAFFIQGQKGDVMWALSFITQVYPEEELRCEVLQDDSDGDAECFTIQNGTFIGGDKEFLKSMSSILPNVWSKGDNAGVSSYGAYDRRHLPRSGEKFVIPDGRVAEYLRMDERFYLADKYGPKISEVLRHNISASLIKDFEDLVSTQAEIDYDVYQIRYMAFMSKVHELEAMLGGLECSCYDCIPICDRGSPYATGGTVDRTNIYDKNSLTYEFDKLVTQKEYNVNDLKHTIRTISKSIMMRINAYDTEYRTYQATGTPESMCNKFRKTMCSHLYYDFVELENLKKLAFPKLVYKALCNEPSGSVMTDFEKLKLRVFGRGYTDYLVDNIRTVKKSEMKKVYMYALKVLRFRFIGNVKL